MTKKEFEIQRALNTLKIQVKGVCEQCQGIILPDGTLIPMSWGYLTGLWKKYEREKAQKKVLQYIKERLPDE